MGKDEPFYTYDDQRKSMYWTNFTYCDDADEKYVHVSCTEFGIMRLVDILYICVSRNETNQYSLQRSYFPHTLIQVSACIKQG